MLDEVHQTLKTVKVEDGHQLLLREGHLPPYGFLQLPVWLLGSQQIAEPPGGGDGSMLSWLASSIQGRVDFIILQRCLKPISIVTDMVNLLLFLDHLYTGN